MHVLIVVLLLLSSFKFNGQVGACQKVILLHWKWSEYVIITSIWALDRGINIAGDAVNDLDILGFFLHRWLLHRQTKMSSNANTTWNCMQGMHRLAQLFIIVTWAPARLKSPAPWILFNSMSRLTPKNTSKLLIIFPLYPIHWSKHSGSSNFNLH